MEKIKTEKVGRKRGRPKLDARITGEYAPGLDHWAAPLF